jgi:glycerol kinase
MGEIVCSKSKEVRQIYPKPGWIEQDPNELWLTQIQAARQVMEVANVKPSQIAGIGVANQRETTIVLERDTGRPIHNAIVWQCRRTADICNELKRSKKNEEIRSRTGLFPDAYFSGTKIK